MSGLILTPVHLRHEMVGAKRNLLKERFDADLEWDSRLPLDCGGRSRGEESSVPVAAWLVGRIQHLVKLPLADFSVPSEDQVTVNLVAKQGQDAPLALVTISIDMNGHVRCLLRGESVTQLDQLLAQLLALLLDEPDRIADAVLQLPGGMRFGVASGAFEGSKERKLDVVELVEQVMDDSVTAPSLEGSEADCPVTDLELARAASTWSESVLPEDLELEAAVRWQDARVWVFRIPRDQFVVAVDLEEGRPPRIELFG